VSRNAILAVAVSAALALSACKQQQARSGPAGPPVVPVSVAKVSQESVPTELRVIGTVEASSIVQVKSQVAGELMRVAFAEGQNVAKNDLLFQIDPRPYDDAVRQAEAAITRDQAAITQQEAALARDSAQAEFARTDAGRYEQLQRAGVVSKSQYDQAKTSADVSRESANATQAAISTARAALESDQAALAKARLDRSYCEIRSPLSGRAGNLLVHGGNLVKANDVPLVVIHQLAPIFVTFSVPEQHLATIRRINANRKLQVRAVPRDNQQRTAAGYLSVIDNTVDSTTGTIHLKGTFENADGLLWPGQFVTVMLALDALNAAAVVPAEAVQNGQQGQFVYVVQADNKVAIRVVKPGILFGKRMVIESGLAPGETVVIDGQLRLFPGATVRTVDPGALGSGAL
jgi:multidrug efflux system membrane fusion protein